MHLKIASNFIFKFMSKVEDFTYKWGRHGCWWCEAFLSKDGAIPWRTTNGYSSLPIGFLQFHTRV